MAEELKKEPTGSSENNGNQYSEYLDVIKKLQENSVPKEKYDELVKEKQEILNRIMSGEKLDSDEKPKVLSNDEARKIIFDENTSNLDYVIAALALRDNILKETGEDIFVPKGHNITATSHDIESAENVADVLGQCIEFAQGDNAIFTAELQRRTKDVLIRRK